jgi:hypothetical protein
LFFVACSKYTFDSPPLARKRDLYGGYSSKRAFSIENFFKNWTCSFFAIALLSTSLLTVVLVLKLVYKIFLVVVQLSAAPSTITP